MVINDVDIKKCKNQLVKDKKIHDKIQRKLQLLQSLRDKKQISTHSYKKARKRLRRKWIFKR